MEVEVSFILDSYRERINKLENENVLLTAQLKQLQNELDKVNNANEEVEVLEQK